MVVGINALRVKVMLDFFVSLALLQTPFYFVFGRGNPLETIPRATAGDWVLLAMWLFVAGVIWQLYRELQAPLIIVRNPNPPRLSRGQRPTELPPPFPNGWFLAALSPELQRGEVRELQVFGKNLVLFRGMDGVASILDAFCPHLGANLGVAGKVNKNCLRCCFHGWEFDTDGKCVKVEGTSTIPPNSTIYKWPTCETNGGIFVWHDADRGEPTWAIPPIDSINEGRWYRAGRTWCHVNAHIQELPENGADAAHLNVLHKEFVWDKAPKSVTHDWTADWAVDEQHPFMSKIRLTQAFHLFGKFIPGSFVVASINQIGPGIVALRLRTPIGHAIVQEFVTPTKTTTQIVQHTMYCSVTIPRFVGKFMLWALEKQFQRDAPIWETKKYESRPVISKADGPILAYRRWFSQFYSPSSLSFADALAKEHMMDW